MGSLINSSAFMNASEQMVIDEWVLKSALNLYPHSQQYISLIAKQMVENGYVNESGGHFDRRYKLTENARAWELSPAHGYFIWIRI